MTLLPNKKKRPCDVGEHCRCFVNYNDINKCPHAFVILDPIEDLGFEFESYPRDYNCENNKYTLTEKDLDVICIDDWKIALYNVQLSDKQSKVCVGIINNDKDVATLKIYQNKQGLHIAEIDLDEKSEKVVIQANMMMRSLQDVVFEQHPDKIRLMVNKNKVINCGRGYLQNLENYLTKITDETIQEWEFELRSLFNVFYGKIAEHRQPTGEKWHIKILPGNRADKMITLLKDKWGYIEQVNNKENHFHFNEKLSVGMAYSKELNMELVNLLRKCGIVVY